VVKKEDFIFKKKVKNLIIIFLKIFLIYLGKKQKKNLKK